MKTSVKAASSTIIAASASTKNTMHSLHSNTAAPTHSISSNTSTINKTTAGPRSASSIAGMMIDRKQSRPKSATVKYDRVPSSTAERMANVSEEDKRKQIDDLAAMDLSAMEDLLSPPAAAPVRRGGGRGRGRISRSSRGDRGASGNYAGGSHRNDWARNMRSDDEDDDEESDDDADTERKASRTENDAEPTSRAYWPGPEIYATTQDIDTIARHAGTSSEVVYGIITRSKYEILPPTPSENKSSVYDVTYMVQRYMTSEGGLVSKLAGCIVAMRLKPVSDLKMSTYSMKYLSFDTRYMSDIARRGLKKYMSLVSAGKYLDVGPCIDYLVGKYGEKKTYVDIINESRTGQHGLYVRACDGIVMQSSDFKPYAPLYDEFTQKIVVNNIEKNLYLHVTNGAGPDIMPLMHGVKEPPPVSMWEGVKVMKEYGALGAVFMSNDDTSYDQVAITNYSVMNDDVQPIRNSTIDTYTQFTDNDGDDVVYDEALSGEIAAPLSKIKVEAEKLGDPIFNLVVSQIEKSLCHQSDPAIKIYVTLSEVSDRSHTKGFLTVLCSMYIGTHNYLARRIIWNSILVVAMGQSRLSTLRPAEEMSTMASMYSRKSNEAYGKSNFMEPRSESARTFFIRMSTTTTSDGQDTRESKYARKMIEYLKIMVSPYSSTKQWLKGVFSEISSLSDEDAISLAWALTTTCHSRVSMEDTIKTLNNQVDAFANLERRVARNLRPLFLAYALVEDLKPALNPKAKNLFMPDCDYKGKDVILMIKHNLESKAV